MPGWPTPVLIPTRAAPRSNSHESPSTATALRLISIIRPLLRSVPPNWRRTEIVVFLRQSLQLSTLFGTRLLGQSPFAKCEIHCHRHSDMGLECSTTGWRDRCFLSKGLQEYSRRCPAAHPASEPVLVLRWAPTKDLKISLEPSSDECPTRSAVVQSAWASRRHRSAGRHPARAGLACSPSPEKQCGYRCGGPLHTASGEFTPPAPQCHHQRRADHVPQFVIRSRQHSRQYD